jgi:hypothetical protein
MAEATHPDHTPGRVPVDIVAGSEPTEARVVLGAGGRIEGVARRRDGRPLAGLQINAWSQSDEGWQARPFPITDGDGRFVIDHIPAGRTSVSLVNVEADSSRSLQTKEVPVAEGETAAVELVVSRDILVTGRVTRSGAPLPHLLLTLRGASGGGIVFLTRRDADDVSARSGPRRLTAVTDQNGAFELIAEPGTYTVFIDSLDRATRFPGRTLEIPDVETYSADIAFSSAPISGVVVDRESEQPVMGASVGVEPRGGSESSWGKAGWTRSAPDGRFSFDAEPGDYTLVARNSGYAEARTSISVGSDGVFDVRIALERGLEIRGRVVDAKGQAVSGVTVTAELGEGVDQTGPEASRAEARTLVDGSFRIAGLVPGRYTLSSTDELTGRAVRRDVRAGEGKVTLMLRAAEHP